MKNNVKYYRKQRKMSQRAVARLIDYSHVAVGKIEKDQVEPLERTKRLLAQVFNVPVEELFPEEHTEVVSVA